MSLHDHTSGTLGEEAEGRTRLFLHVCTGPYITDHLGRSMSLHGHTSGTLWEGKKQEGGLVRYFVCVYRSIHHGPSRKTHELTGSYTPGTLGEEAEGRTGLLLRVCTGPYITDHLRRSTSLQGHIHHGPSQKNHELSWSYTSRALSEEA